MTLSTDRNNEPNLFVFLGKGLQITVLGSFVFLLLVGFNLNVADKGYFKTLNSGLVVNTKKLSLSFLKHYKQYPALSGYVT